MSKKLSILKNATEGCITYYTGLNEDDVMHLNNLKNCTLICRKDFFPDLGIVNVIQVENPQLSFYELSQTMIEDYIESDSLVFNMLNKSYIHKNAKIGNNVQISPGCIIGNCEIQDNVIIHPNVTIYKKSKIGSNVQIGAGTVIGAEGVMWTYNSKTNDRILLHQLGGVIIQDNCFISSNVTIVRGSANENTIIGNSTYIAPGTCIGHGTLIHDNVHFANNVSTGGSSEIASHSFLGSGSIISPRCKITERIVLGAGSCLLTNATKAGVYVGTPAKWIKEIESGLSGTPI